MTRPAIAGGRTSRRHLLTALPLVCVALVAAVSCATRTRQVAVPPVGAPPVTGPSSATPAAATPAAAAPAATTGAPATRAEIIAAMKAYQARVGFAPTGNFAARTNEAYPGRCYYTGILELPDSYQQLRVVAAADGRCPLDESQFDVFPYALETAATGSSPVTPALEGATLERLLMLVPHEDFHNQPEAKGAPQPLAEAAAMLAGFVTAAGFAREYFGPDTAIVRHLAAESVLFSTKAVIVNRFFDDVAALYAGHRAGQVPATEVFDRKRQLFSALARACLTSGPAPVSFNRCPAVFNNAGLAFDRTYSRDYQPLFERAPHRDVDVAGTIRMLRETLAASPA